MQKIDFFLVMIGITMRILVGCKGWDDPQPSAFQPVPGAPCGNLGVDCGHKMCCDEGETCGDRIHGCPIGACCDVRTPPAFLHYGDSGIVNDRDAGPIVVVTHPQRQAP
jgi:hypothetical protein